MIKVIVRGGSDASAIRATCSRFFKGVINEVINIGGRKGSFWDRVLDVVKDNTDSYYLVLTGRRDYDSTYYELIDSIPNVATYLVPKAEVRNATLGELMKYLSICKTKFRLALGIESTTLLVKVAERKLLSSDVLNPAYDSFLIINEGLDILEKLISRDVLGDTLLVIRELGGLHKFYGGYGSELCSIRFTEDGLTPKVVNVRGGELKGLNLINTIARSKDVLHRYEEVVINFLRDLARDFDEFVVPWSGGKDSTATLYLAIKALGKSSLNVIYVDTGLDFLEVKEYVERVSELLGINYEVLHAPVREELLRGRELPTHDNRWCTYLKRRAILSYIERLFRGRRVLVIIGDRDAESIGRSRKGFIESDRDLNNVVNTYPIKLWGGTHVQLYLLSNGIDLCRLYSKGFYRVGCYVCPALRSWELFIIVNTSIRNALNQCPIWNRFLRSRLTRS